MALKWPPMSIAQGAGRKAKRSATTITMSSSLSRNGPPRDLDEFGEDFFLGLMAASAARIPETPGTAKVAPPRPASAHLIAPASTLRRADQPKVAESRAAPHRTTRILPWQQIKNRSRHVRAQRPHPRPAQRHRGGHRPDCAAVCLDPGDQTAPAVQQHSFVRLA